MVKFVDAVDQLKRKLGFPETYHGQGSDPFDPKKQVIIAVTNELGQDAAEMLVRLIEKIAKRDQKEAPAMEIKEPHTRGGKFSINYTIPSSEAEEAIAGAVANVLRELNADIPIPDPAIVQEINRLKLVAQTYKDRADRASGAESETSAYREKKY